MITVVNQSEQFIEDTGLIFENIGLGRTPGRIIGALMINDPPYMNMNEIVECTSMSKASISTGLSMLTSVGFIQKFSIPSERPDYYRIDSDFWMNGIMAKMTAMEGFRQSLGKAIEIIASKKEDKHPERTKTLEEMFEMYQFFERRLPQLFEEWESIRKEKFT